MRVLLVTLELADPIFSGNGVYGRTIVEALLSNPGTSVDAICGCPVSEASSMPPPFTTHALAHAVQQSRLHVSRVPLPTWKKHDRGADWERFAQGATTAMLARDEFDVVIGVDWTAAPAVDVLLRRPKTIHMNFRVFFAQLELLDSSTDDLAFYTEKERFACAAADLVIALTFADAASLSGLLPPPGATSVAVLNPPLRPDIVALASEIQRVQPQRRYITICARISEEKRVAEFVQIVAAAKNSVIERNLVPLIIGEPTSPAYAESCIEQLKQNFPGDRSEVRGFGGPKELAAVWEQTLLNIHTACYEAYGMTIVEAASFGVPTLLHTGTIGAKDLIPPTGRFETSMDDISAAGAALSALLDQGESHLLEAGVVARTAARTWDVAAFSAKLRAFLEAPSGTI